MSFENRVCVITGASSGIGRRTALDLAFLGARVCVAARRENRLESLLLEMGGEKQGHSLHVTDVSSKQSVKSLAEHVSSAYGRVDVLINNAGFSDHTSLEDPRGVASLERVMATNFYGAVYCTAELLPLLMFSAPSTVVNVASVAGRLALGGDPAYCASKFALVGWSEALQSQLSGKGVHVGVVEPGLIPTEGFPQAQVQTYPLLRKLLGTEAQVSAAILDLVRRRVFERTVPRWYYLLQLPRLLAPPLYRAAERRLIAPRRIRPPQP
ncbi:MAG: SDR family oxidoreductase [Actinomycetota bacterium]|nr:SDR family oxidoreductase [Actinomycetota bacterium]